MEGKDHISELPITIQHNIIAWLSEKEIDRTSILVKGWEGTFYKFPILSLIGPKNDTAMFCEYVRKKFTSLLDEKLDIKQFKLILNSHHNRTLHTIGKEEIDNWLELVAKNGGEVIELEEGCFKHIIHHYVFPKGILESKSVVVLNLTNHIMINSSMYDNTSIVFALRELRLYDVVLEKDNTIEELMARCPSLECVSVKMCSIIPPSPIADTSTVRKHIRKQYLTLKCGLPNLKRVSCSHISNGIEMDCDCCCQNFKELNIGFGRVAKDLFRKFCFLESLSFEVCHLPPYVVFISDTLKKLRISFCRNLKKFVIDAPNLVLCEYETGDPSTSVIKFRRRSRKLEVDIKLSETHYDVICKLSDLFKKIKPSDVWKSVCLFIREPMYPVNPILTQGPSPSLPPRIKQLTLCFSPDKRLFSPLADILFSSCLPSALNFSLVTYDVDDRAFIELFYEKVMKKLKDGDLKDVKVIPSIKIEEDAPMKTILELMA